MNKGRQLIREGAPHPAQPISPPPNPSTTSPPAPLRPEPRAASPEPPGGPANEASVLRQEQALASVPLSCPVCGAATEEVPSLDTRRTRGWWCQPSRSLHFWQWRALALREWMAKRRYAIPPVLGSNGIPDYPGVTFEDLKQARRDMRADRERWHAQGYDPKG